MGLHCPKIRVNTKIDVVVDNSRNARARGKSGHEQHVILVYWMQDGALARARGWE